MTKPMFGYLPQPGKQDTDRSAALKKLDSLIGVSSSNQLKNDQEHLKGEASAIFGQKKALSKYLAGISKPKFGKEQEDDSKEKNEKKDQSRFDEVVAQRKQLRGVSNRFPQRGDWDSADTYLYVSPTSTAKEKMLHMRSHLIGNQ